ncbi:dynamin family protein [Dethiobacter alkaliphilus]|uniref:Dynamin family protein n=1 Tax=Dethiobacter alkaliphilus AHT 1 TaxID=555088 RepID=C0GJU7_DETAL|nr:dynamin family protein [Dethiobacter alkaliphilus]EEG76405.1 Dynamin family protein [Dethiobacter alkaliphilus AHT 1]
MEWDQQFDLAGLIKQAKMILESHQEFAAEAGRLEELWGRLANERFHLAVLGQFKRGKSTFINALLGTDLLPTSVVPLTAIPTFLLWSPQIGVTVHYQNDKTSDTQRNLSKEALKDTLARIVTEEGNPHNEKGISYVEILYPSSFLNNGVVLIDTPGIGSTHQHNTEMTLDFLAQCDAALFVVSADPPITEVEVEFLKQVEKAVARIFFIVNKADYLDKQEKKTYLSFLEKVLKEQAGFNEVKAIFAVSALQGLEAAVKQDDDLLAKSGLKEVQAFLLDFINKEKKDVLQQALRGKASAIIAEALMRLQLLLNSMQMPLSQLEQNLETFADKIEEAKQQRVVAKDLLAGDRKRLVDYLEEQSEELRGKANEHFSAMVDEFLARSGDNFNEQDLVAKITDEIPLFFEKELRAKAEEFQKKVAEVLGRHQQRADKLIGEMSKAAAELFDVPYLAPESADAFLAKKEPYWVTHKLDAALSPLPKAMLGRLLPSGMQRSMTSKRYKEKIRELVVNNVENLRWATLQNLDHAFRTFASVLDERLQSTIVSTYGAMETVREKRVNHSRSLTPEIENMQNLKNEMDEIQQKIGCCGR